LKSENSFLDRRTGFTGLTRAVSESGELHKTIQLDWKLVWQRSAHLAHLHTQKLLCRTLDTLHVAAAESCCADLLVTGDKRQFQLGKAVGLPTLLVPDTI
jgi:hypothetical protein